MSCIESIRIAHSGLYSRIRRAACRPVSFGIEMSRIARSNRAAARSATASAPSPASATTSKSTSSSRIRRRPARTSVWSSAMRIADRHRRSRAVAVREPDLGAARRRGARRAGRRRSSSARSRMPRIPPAVLRRRRAMPDARRRATAQLARRRRRRARLTCAALARGMADDVGEALLRDAVDHELGVGVQPRQRPVERAADDQPGAVLDRGRTGCAAPATSPSSSSTSGRSARASRRTTSSVSLGRGRRRLELVARARAGAAGPARSSCSTSAVSRWPISSCSSAATRRRSASWATSARCPLVAPLASRGGRAWR